MKVKHSSQTYITSCNLLSSPFYSEGSDGARGHVDAQVLEVGDTQTASVAEDPCARQTVRYIWQPCRHKHRQVSYGQADQVAVGWRPHVARGEDDEDHHDVAHNTHATHQQDQENWHGLVLQRLGHRHGGAQGDVGRGVNSGANVVGHVYRRLSVFWLVTLITFE